MKKCPFCNAEIEENARFCLYCMTSFEEKESIKIKKENKKTVAISITAAVLVLAVIVGAFFAAKPKDENDSSGNTPSDKETSASQVGESSPSSEDFKTDNENPKEQQTAGEQGGNSSDKTTTNPENKDDNPKKEPEKSDEETSSPTTSSTVSTTQPTTSKASYSYIEGTLDNCYPTGHAPVYPPENAIVITKVNSPDSSGNYVIPETIDGKRVAAIMPSAFSDAKISSTVKSVTLPASVKTVWQNAFANCYNLTDIYIKSSVIGIYENAFPSSSLRTDSLTIHCSYNCRNYDFYYYRNIANNYNAKFEEWNG